MTAIVELKNVTKAVSNQPSLIPLLGHFQLVAGRSIF